MNDVDIDIFYFSLKRYTFMVHIDKPYKIMGNIYIDTIKTKWYNGYHSLKEITLEGLKNE